VAHRHPGHRRSHRAHLYRASRARRRTIADLSGRAGAPAPQRAIGLAGARRAAAGVVGRISGGDLDHRGSEPAHLNGRGTADPGAVPELAAVPGAPAPKGSVRRRRAGVRGAGGDADSIVRPAVGRTARGRLGPAALAIAAARAPAITRGDVLVLVLAAQP